MDLWYSVVKKTVFGKGMPFKIGFILRKSESSWNDSMTHVVGYLEFGPVISLLCLCDLSLERGKGTVNQNR